MKEQWKDIEDFPGYQVGSFGNVRSFKKRTKHGWIISDIPQRILSPNTSQTYKSVCLIHNGIRYQKRIHALVAQAFLGPCSDEDEICHTDGNPCNNHIDNLHYGTHIENMHEAALHSSYKFAPGQIRTLRALHSNGATYVFLARLFKVAARSISLICRGETYSIIEGPCVSSQQPGLQNAKITASDAASIRMIYVQGETTMKEIGLQFGISASAVSLIVNHKRWANDTKAQQ